MKAYRLFIHYLSCFCKYCNGLYFGCIVRRSSLLSLTFFARNWQNIHFQLYQTSKTNKLSKWIKGRTINLVSFVKIYITDILYKPEKDVNPHHALWVFDLMDRIECRTTLINILLALLFQYQKLFWLKYFVEISKNLKYFI